MTTKKGPNANARMNKLIWYMKRWKTASSHVKDVENPMGLLSTELSVCNVRGVRREIADEREGELESDR